MSKEKVDLIFLAKDKDKIALTELKALEAKKKDDLTTVAVSEKLTVSTTNQNRLNEYIKKYGKL
jgi:predicted nucleotide-binding protein